MPRPLVALLATAILILAACGVDGEPERPTRAEAPPPGLAISGQVSVGFTGSF